MMNLIGEDIKLMRDRYDQALDMLGIPCRYQFPNIPDSNAQGEASIDSYSEFIETSIIFEGKPKVTTFKRCGWVVENGKELPFLIHCSYNLQHLQRDCLFHISGQYTGMPDRVFRVTELSCDIQAPDHMIAQVIPVYDKQTVGRTPMEVKKTFNKSNYFLKSPTDYRGHYISEQKGEK